MKDSYSIPPTLESTGGASIKTTFSRAEQISTMNFSEANWSIKALLLISQSAQIEKSFRYVRLDLQALNSSSNSKRILAYINHKLRLHSLVEDHTHQVRSYLLSVIAVLQLALNGKPENYVALLKTPLLLNSECKLNKLQLYEAIHFPSSRKDHFNQCAEDCKLFKFFSGITILKTATKLKAIDKMYFLLHWFAYDDIFTEDEKRLFHKSFLKKFAALIERPDSLQEKAYLLVVSFPEKQYIREGKSFVLDMSKRTLTETRKRCKNQIVFQNNKIISEIQLPFADSKYRDIVLVGIDELYLSIVDRILFKIFRQSEKTIPRRVAYSLNEIVKRMHSPDFTVGIISYLDISKIYFAAFLEIEYLLLFRKSSIEVTGKLFSRFLLPFALLLSTPSISQSVVKSKKINTLYGAKRANCDQDKYIELIPSIAKYLLKCPYRYFLALHNYRYRERSALASFGTIVHRALSNVLNQKITNNQQLLETIDRMIGDKIVFAQWRDLFKKFTINSKVVFDYLADTMTLYRDSLMNNIRLKHSVKISNCNFAVSSIMDLVIKKDNALYEVIEFKLPKDPIKKAFAKNSIQLIVYRWMIQQSMGGDTIGAIYDLNSGKKIYQELTQSDVNIKFYELLEQATTLLRRHNFEYKAISNSGCYRCSFTEFCTKNIVSHRLPFHP
jgi:CRISPR/Cas system-associated exonuclease Cas4 (RecB family)